MSRNRRSLNEIKDIIQLMGIILFIGIIVTCTGCRSQPQSINSSTVVEQYTRSIAELETRNQQFANLFREFEKDIDNISASAARAGTSIDLAIFYFTEYNRRVEQLIRDFNSLQREIGHPSEND